MIYIQRFHHSNSLAHSVARFSTTPLSQIWRQCNIEQRENFFRHQDGKYLHHKKFTRELITKMTKNMADKKIAVYGPGLSEPLQQLAEKNIVYLVDHDELTLKEVSKGLPKERVKLIKFDLTHGLCESFEEALDKNMENDVFPESCLEKIISLFSNFEFSRTTLPLELYGVDCALSSNVSSQLTAQIEGVVKRAFKARYKCDLLEDVLFKYPFHTSKYYEALAHLKLILPQQHFKDLVKSIKENGYLYYADTLFAKNKGNITSVPSQALDILHANFKTLEHKVWDLEAIENSYFIVHGYIMRKV